MKEGTEGTKAGVSAARVLLRLAQLEQDGIEFYEGMREGTKSDWVRRLAGFLIEAEKRHRTRFLAYAERCKQSADPGESALEAPLPPDVARLLASSLFVSGERMKKSAPYARDIEIIKVAIRAEEKAALLMSQLLLYVPHRERPYIRRVISEEWAHKNALEDVLQRYLLKKQST